MRVTRCIETQFLIDNAATLVKGRSWIAGSSFLPISAWLYPPIIWECCGAALFLTSRTEKIFVPRSGERNRKLHKRLLVWTKEVYWVWRRDNYAGIDQWKPKHLLFVLQSNFSRPEGWIPFWTHSPRVCLLIDCFPRKPFNGKIFILEIFLTEQKPFNYRRWGKEFQDVLRWTIRKNKAPGLFPQWGQ